MGRQGQGGLGRRVLSVTNGRRATQSARPEHTTGGLRLNKDSLTEHDPQDGAGQALDSWAWILRARAAARRAVEHATPQPNADESDAEPGCSAPG
jgi:hypothetical protein